jgi:hypothetical protein
MLLNMELVPVQTFSSQISDWDWKDSLCCLKSKHLYNVAVRATVGIIHEVIVISRGAVRDGLALLDTFGLLCEVLLDIA